MIFTPKKGTNIYKRKDGRWEARYLKSINQDGKRIYGSVYGKTFDEAKRKQEEVIQNHSPVMKKTLRVVLKLQEISAEWKDSIKQTVKESTYLKYDTIIRKHILSHDISTVNISNLTTKEIHEFSEQLCKEGLSAKTVNDILVVLGLILKYAEDIYKISKPKIKYIKVQKKELRVLSSQEQMVLERFLLQETDSYKLGILIALYTGIRIGELCALQWEDVQLDRIIINKTVQRLKNGDKTFLSVTPPKTSSSVRDIPIPEFLKKFLQSFREKGSVVKNRKGNSVEPRLMQYLIVHVGDTRVYQIGAKMNQLTTDQTFVAREIGRGTMTVEQAKNDKRRNLLLQCIGASTTVDPQVLIGDVEKGAYLICSDGFRHEISDAEMFESLNPVNLVNEKSMHSNTRYLIDLVKQRKEKDNISAVVIKTI